MLKEIDMRKSLITLLAPLVFMNVAHADFVADAQSHAAKVFRKQLPMKIDEVTTLLTVASAGRTGVYSYRMDLFENELPLDWRQKQTSLMRHNVCSQPIMSKLMKQGASYAYQYVDKSGKFLVYIKIENSDC